MADSIWSRKQDIESARREKMKEMMDEYDKTVYYPALKALREECVATHGSHSKTTYHDNGFGWEWWYCGRCGAKHSENQYSKLEDDNAEG